MNENRDSWTTITSSLLLSHSMVFFWVNNRSFDIFNFFLEEYGTKGPLPKESVLQLALAFKEHGIREFEY